MIIVFGRRNSPKDFGPTVPCTNCRHRTVLHYVRSMTWFHLFFVPVFRSDREDALVCPVCGCCIWLSAEQGEMARAVAIAYGSWAAHLSSDEQYNAVASPLLRSVAPVEREIERLRRGSADEPDDVASALPPRDFADSATWRADPSGRHELRFWDGSEWTAYVSDAGSSPRQQQAGTPTRAWATRRVTGTVGAGPTRSRTAACRRTIRSRRRRRDGSGQTGTTSTGMPFTAWLFDSVSKKCVGASRLLFTPACSRATESRAPGRS
jgi:zinc-ribbon family/Protein of unknown function (DUF2510)